MFKIYAKADLSESVWILNFWEKFFSDSRNEAVSN